MENKLTKKEERRIKFLEEDRDMFGLTNREENELRFLKNKKEVETVSDEDLEAAEVMHDRNFAH